VTELSVAFGEAAARADAAGMARLESVYWYTLEFGMAWEEGRPKVWGAGLLSSIGELERAVGGGVEVLDWDLETMACTPYDPTDYQPQLFAAPGFEGGLRELREWLREDRWRPAPA
jgi:phenylalanine-4-hydroxylase